MVSVTVIKNIRFVFLPKFEMREKNSGLVSVVHLRENSEKKLDKKIDTHLRFQLFSGSSEMITFTYYIYPKYLFLWFPAFSYNLLVFRFIILK